MLEVTLQCLCRTWGLIILSVAFVWQTYTKWQLIMMHESEPGKRIRSYVELSQESFGNPRILVIFLEISESMVRVQSVHIDSMIHVV